jgi:antitoxin PrlF
VSRLRREISTITAKGQTTVPKSVRQALGLGTGDRIAFSMDERGVVLTRAEAENEDPVIDRFLSFLADDMEKHPERIVAFPENLAAQIAVLTEGVVVDLDAPIDGEVEL